MAFSGYFLLERFGRRLCFVKYTYRINISQTDDFGDRADSYLSA